MMSRLRIPLLLILGAVIGLGLGLYLGWEIYPTEFIDANPALLADTHKQTYARMIAAAYAVDGDLPAAQTRIESLGDAGTEILTAVMLDALLQPQNETETQQLVKLANDLGIYSPAMDPYLTPSNPAEPSSP